MEYIMATSWMYGDNPPPPPPPPPPEDKSNKNGEKQNEENEGMANRQPVVATVEKSTQTVVIPYSNKCFY
jgi:hypothetical protein